MWFLFGEVPLPLGAWDGLRYFIVALPEPSIYLFLIEKHAFRTVRIEPKIDFLL